MTSTRGSTRAMLAACLALGARAAEAGLSMPLTVIPGLAAGENPEPINTNVAKDIHIRRIVGTGVSMGSGLAFGAPE